MKVTDKMVELAEDRYWNFGDDNAERSMRAALEAVFSLIEKESTWHKPSDSLPDEGAHILIAKKGAIVVGWYRNGFNIYDIHTDMKKVINDIDYWMLLELPPQAGKKESAANAQPEPRLTLTKIIQCDDCKRIIEKEEVLSSLMSGIEKGLNEAGYAKEYTAAAMHTGDIFADLQGNKYQVKEQPDNEGWIIHDGSSLCPINEDTKIDQFFDHNDGLGGVLSTNIRAGNLHWEYIIRYRILPNQTPEEKCPYVDCLAKDCEQCQEDKENGVFEPREEKIPTLLTFTTKRLRAIGDYNMETDDLLCHISSYLDKYMMEKS